MTIENIKRAQAEAKRFLERVDDLIFQINEPIGLVWRPSKESGALRRASMDLTRALAEMRRP